MCSSDLTQIFEGNDRIIGIGEFINFKRTRLVLVNSDSVIFKSNYIPDLPEYKLENIDLGFFGNIFWHFSPLNNKLVSGNYNGLVLEIYDVDNTEIKISSVKVFEKPIYSMNERNNRPESIEGESICGFTRIYVTSENIYASYNGSTDDLNFVDKIIEFDLDGNPLRILKFDNISITGICVDESRDRNRIYMTVVNDDRDFFIVYADI